MFTFCVIIYFAIAVIAFNVLRRQNMVDSVVYDLLCALFWLPVGIGMAMFMIMVLAYAIVAFSFGLLGKSLEYLSRFGDELGKRT